jgi:hypothetical protein
MLLTIIFTTMRGTASELSARGGTGDRERCGGLTERTTGCIDGLPNWDIITRGGREGVDAVSEEIVRNITTLGSLGIELWKVWCNTHPDCPTEDVVLPTITVVEKAWLCTMNGFSVTFSADAKDPAETFDGVKDCSLGSRSARRGTDPCTVDEPPSTHVCTRPGVFDYTLLSYEFDKTCSAQGMRDDIAAGGEEMIQEFADSCRKRRRLTYWKSTTALTSMTGP